ncbi:MAG: GNAT family N-acetyltransferase [Ardenticatenaceae bacterium]
MSNSSKMKHLEMFVDSEMIRDQLDHTREEIIDFANNHIQAVQAWLSTRTPQAKRFEGTGVIANSSGLAVPLLNLALGSHYPAGTSDELIEQEIESVKTFYAYQSVPWLWWIPPNATPADMPQRLMRHDLRCNLKRPVMVAPLPAKCPPINPNVEVWPASTSAHLEVASTIRRIGFGFPDGQANNYYEGMAHNWLNDGKGTVYMAKVKDGPPAAIGSLITGAGLPGVYAMATLPEWRRHGLGSAILARILSDAAANGHHFIVLTASPLGYPLYAKFGFLHIFNYQLFGWGNNGISSGYKPPRPTDRRNTNRSLEYDGQEKRRTHYVNTARMNGYMSAHR